MGAAAAVAEVKIKVLPDGSRVIYNEVPRTRVQAPYAGGMIAPRPYVAQLIDLHARRAGLDPRLVQAVVQVESGYRIDACSSKGAMGLMQLMPETASDLEVTDAYDPDQNVRGGTAYLRWLIDRYAGDLQLALAAYNAGPTAVDRHGGVPPYRETQTYVQKVLRLVHGRAPMIRSAAVAADRPVRVGGVRPAPIYVVRDANDQLVFTTEAPLARPN